MVLIPEIDLPGHCFAALAAVPALVDPHDTSGAVSVQHFVDNVLNPGVPTTWPLLEAAFGELADRFPAPWLHLGGDEVPRGAWLGSPLAMKWGVDRGATDTNEVGASFLREVVALVRRTTGRLVGVWQEAAESGALGARRRLRRRVALGRGVSAAGRGGLPGRGRARRALLPRHGRVGRLVRARDELGRELVARRCRSVRSGGRLVVGRAVQPARCAGVPVDRARPRPTDDGAAALPAAHRNRRRRMAGPVAALTSFVLPSAA